MDKRIIDVDASRDGFPIYDGGGRKHLEWVSSCNGRARVIGLGNSKPVSCNNKRRGNRPVIGGGYKTKARYVAVVVHLDGVFCLYTIDAGDIGLYCGGVAADRSRQRVNACRERRISACSGR